MTEGEFILCNEYVDINKHIDTEYYQNIFVPLRSHHALAGVMCRDGTHESAFALTRGPEQEPYTCLEKNLFKILTPHLSRAMHIFKELKLYKSYSNISKSILDQSEKAIIVCRTDGKIVISNQFANDKLIEPCPVFLDINKVKINNKIIQKKLEHYIEQCSSLSYKAISIQETIIIDNKENSDNILITVSPLTNQNDFNNVSEACCLITVTFQQQLNWPKLQKEFQLTAKELQLLKAIYSKKKLHQLTSVFNVSYNTLRTHLQSIFRKVKVNSQTELMVKINLFK